MSFLKNIFSPITFRLFTGLIIVALSGCLNVGSNGSGTISSIAITPESAQIPTGGTLNYNATATYGDGTTSDVTNQVSWTSSNALATTTGNVATGVGVGTATITASFGGTSSNAASLKVTAPYAIAISPTTAAVGVGLSTRLTATQTNPDLSTSATTGTVIWKSSATSIATVDTTGLVTGVVAGTATITATQNGATSNSVTVTVTPWTITLSASAGTIYVGGSSTLTATQNLTGGTTNNITSQVTWASSSPSVATVSTSGAVTGVGLGTTTITATLNGVSGTTIITVATPETFTGSSWNFPSPAYWATTTDSTLPVNPSAAVLKETTPTSSSFTTVANKFVNLASSGNVSYYEKFAIGYYSTYDTLTFSIDGVSQHVQSAALSWTNRSYTIPAGAHTLSWSYLSYYDYNYTGSASISQVVIVPPSMSTTVVGTQQGGARQGTTLSTSPGVTTLAGSGSGGSTDATGPWSSFYGSRGITTDGINLYVADYYYSKIRKIVIATGVVTTLAGSGTLASTDNTGLLASFYYPTGITTDGTNLYVTDYSGNKIRKIAPSSGTLSAMTSANAVVTTLAGSGTASSTDNTGLSASFYYPTGITTDGTNLYVTDYGGSKIRKIAPSSGTLSAMTSTNAVVTTLAGSGTLTSTNNTGLLASFYWPSGITTDGTNLYVTEYGGNLIRKIAPASGTLSAMTSANAVVTTLAGTGTAGVVNGTGTTLVQFNAPSGITTDGTNLYVTDYNGFKIRKIAPASGTLSAMTSTNATVTTLAGSGSSLSTDNATALSASFGYPYGITTDGTNLFVTDFNGSKIRELH